MNESANKTDQSFNQWSNYTQVCISRKPLEYKSNLINFGFIFNWFKASTFHAVSAFHHKSIQSQKENVTSNVIGTCVLLENNLFVFCTSLTCKYVPPNMLRLIKI